MTCPEAESVGAYVLGGLDPGEYTAVEQHIRDCAGCRETVLQFAHVPGVLRQLTLEDVLALEQADVVPVHRRFTPKRVLLAAAAVVLLLAGGLIGHQLEPQAQTGTTWSATNGVGGLDAQVRLSSRDWGTDLQLRLADTQPGQRCMLVVHTRGGQSETTGWWTSTNGDELDVPASSSYALSDITRVDVVTADSTVLTSLTESSR
jgi:hypothetical protein